MIHFVTYRQPDGHEFVPPEVSHVALPLGDDDALVAQLFSADPAPDGAWEWDAEPDLEQVRRAIAHGYPVGSLNPARVALSHPAYVARWRAFTGPLYWAAFEESEAGIGMGLRVDETLQALVAMRTRLGCPLPVRSLPATVALEDYTYVRQTFIDRGYLPGVGLSKLDESAAFGFTILGLLRPVEREDFFDRSFPAG